MAMDLSETLIVVYACAYAVVTGTVAMLAFATIFHIKAEASTLLSNKKALYLWLLSTWKMRAVYTCSIVHIFDFITDLLVIHEWYIIEDGTSEKDVAHIDSPLMASWSVAILIFHRIISSFAIFISSNRDLKQAILQLFDILLFVDMYETHQRLAESVMNEFRVDWNLNSASSISKDFEPSQTQDVSQMTTTTTISDPNDYNYDDYSSRNLSRRQSLMLRVTTKSQSQASDSDGQSDTELYLSRSPSEKSMELSPSHSIQQRRRTSSIARTRKVKLNRDAVALSLRFKYLRALESLFEATPQAVLQLVYVMRTTQFKSIFVLSIFQSLLSMTNAMLNEDNSYMTHKKWKKYKKRFPIPHIKFIRHFLFRLSEISYRVGLFALFWTVVGGFAFSIVLIIEMLFPLIYNSYKLIKNKYDYSLNEFLLSLTIIITMPPEWMFEKFQIHGENDKIYIFFNAMAQGKLCQKWLCLFVIVMCILAPFWLIIDFFRWLTCHPIFSQIYYHYTSLRMFVSLIEYLIIISYHFWWDLKGYGFLLRLQHALGVFVISGSFFIIYALFYPILMPDIHLPDHINLRSKLGHSYLGNIEELKKLDIKHLNIIALCQKYFDDQMQGNQRQLIIQKKLIARSSININQFENQLEKYISQMKNANKQITSITQEIDQRINQLTTKLLQETRETFADDKEKRANQQRKLVDHINNKILEDEIDLELKEELSHLDEELEQYYASLRAQVDAELQLESESEQKQSLDKPEQEQKPQSPKRSRHVHGANLTVDYNRTIRSRRNSIEMSSEKNLRFYLKLVENEEQQLKLDIARIGRREFNNIKAKRENEREWFESQKQMIVLLRVMIKKFKKRIKNTEQRLLQEKEIVTLAQLEIDALEKTQNLQVNVRHLQNQCSIIVTQIKKMYDKDTRQLMPYYERKKAIINVSTTDEIIKKDEALLKHCNSIANYVPEMCEQYWSQCLYYAKKNKQKKTIKWLRAHGAKITKEEAKILKLSRTTSPSQLQQV